MSVLLIVLLTAVEAADEPPTESKSLNRAPAQSKQAALERDHMLDQLAPIIATRVAARDTRHPVFHGCIDWHSAVHGHWGLLRIARTTGRHNEEADAVNRSLSPEGIAQEAALLRSNGNFEMPYGRAWFLLLAEEFQHWASEHKLPDPQRLRPMAVELAASLERYLTGATLNPEIGEYSNPSWALLRLHAWYAFSGDAEGKLRIEKLVAGIKASDLAAAGFGADLKRSEFFSRYGNYATLLCAAQPATLEDVLKKRPITADELSPLAALPRAAHGLGLNWSRAWALKALAENAPDEADRQRFQEAYAAHVAAAWKHHGLKAGDIYAYDHWVPQFAVYALTE